MRLSAMRMMVAAAVATPAIAAATPSGGPAAVDARTGLPASRLASAGPSAAAGPQQRPAVQYYVDLNSAGRKELMTLPGIGAEEADRIIARRPYLTKTDLVTKDALPLGPFLSIKRLVVAMPPTVSKGRR
jgi:DNA uptake protein ComE-like DNA-binding protein